MSKKLLDIGEAYEEAISRIATLERELAEAREEIDRLKGKWETSPNYPHGFLGKPNKAQLELEARQLQQQRNPPTGGEETNED